MILGVFKEVGYMTGGRISVFLYQSGVKVCLPSNNVGTSPRKYIQKEQYMLTIIAGLCTL